MAFTSCIYTVNSYIESAITEFFVARYCDFQSSGLFPRRNRPKLTGADSDQLMDGLSELGSPTTSTSSFQASVSLATTVIHIDA